MKVSLITLQRELCGLDRPSRPPGESELTYRGSGRAAARTGGATLLGVLVTFLRPPSHENSEMLLPRVLVLPDLKRAALTLRRPFHGIRPVDFGSHPAASRRRLRGARGAPLFRGAAALRSGLRGVRSAPLQPDTWVTHQPVPLRAREPEVEVATRARRARGRRRLLLLLLQLEDKAPLPGASRSIWNVLQRPAPGLRGRRAPLAVGPKGRQPHLAHVGAGGAVLDPQPAPLGAPGGRRLGLLAAVGGSHRTPG